MRHRDLPERGIRAGLTPFAPVAPRGLLEASRGINDPRDAFGCSGDPDNVLARIAALQNFYAPTKDARNCLWAVPRLCEPGAEEGFPPLPVRAIKSRV